VSDTDAELGVDFVPFWRIPLLLNVSEYTFCLVVGAVRALWHLPIALDLLLSAHIARLMQMLDSLPSKGQSIIPARCASSWRRFHRCCLDRTHRRKGVRREMEELGIHQSCKLRRFGEVETGVAAVRSHSILNHWTYGPFSRRHFLLICSFKAAYRGCVLRRHIAAPFQSCISMTSFEL
jgi:hypothetical protein